MSLPSEKRLGCGWAAELLVSAFKKVIVGLFWGHPRGVPTVSAFLREMGQVPYSSRCIRINRNSPKISTALRPLPEHEPLLAFDKPQFEVKLHPDVLTLHVKEGAVREFDRLAEQTPHIRDSLRWMFHEIIPLKVRLQDIEHVDSDNMGRVRIKVPARRDIHIPLDHEESNKLVEKLNELIPREKERAFERRKASEESKEQVRREEDEGFPYIRKPA